MVDATQVQEGRRASARATALATCLILLGVGWMGARHQAEVAHVRDAAGRIVHANELADHHEASPSAHLHGRADHGHTGTCALLAITHPRLVYGATPAVPQLGAHTIARAAPPAQAPRSSLAAYRLAPKTSPPALG